jgi:alpha-L-rhamnosidase
MGDAEVFARTACFNADVAGFLTKWLRDVRDTQSPAAFPDVAPDRNQDSSGAPAWGDAGVIVPWQVYRCYGDTRVLADQYDAMKRWVAFVKDGNPDLLWRNRAGANYGDWLNMGADAPRHVLATAYFANSARLVAKAAAVLGKPDDARQYEALFQDVRAAFNRAFVKPDGRIQGDTQTIYLLALRFDLLPEVVRPRVVERLVKDIVETRGGHLSTGFLGVSHLNPVLTEIGQLDLAYGLLLNETFPSWGYSIKQGATTIWERWDGWTKEKGFQDPGMNSFNHYSLGSVGEWMYAVVAGIDLDPDVPGYKRILLRPRPGGGLSWAMGALRTPYGRVLSKWRIADGRLHWGVVVPPNTTASVVVPTSDPASVTEGGRLAAQAEGVVPRGPAAFEIQSGTYVFEAKP